MSKFHVLILDDRYPAYDQERNVLKAVDAEIEVIHSREQAAAQEAAPRADGVLVNLHPLPRAVIDRLGRCRVISRYGVGYDNVDVAAATAKGIWVARVPDYCLEDVSDQALALLLACVRKVAYKDRRVRAGAWNLTAEQPCYRIAGRTLGLIGYGAIARTLHRKVSGLGLARVLVYDPLLEPVRVRESGATPVSLEVLLEESDYISVHAPLSDQTRGLIGERELAHMKKGSLLINTSRGPLVDERALAQALAQGRIAGAGLDVFESEPLPADSPLRRLENVTLSDHAGWYSEESIVELKTKAAQNVAAVLTGGRPAYPVNEPK